MVATCLRAEARTLGRPMVAQRARGSHRPRKSRSTMSRMASTRPTVQDRSSVKDTTRGLVRVTQDLLCALATGVWHTNVQSALTQLTSGRVATRRLLKNIACRAMARFQKVRKEKDKDTAREKEKEKEKEKDTEREKEKDGGPNTENLEQEKGLP